MTGPNIFDFPTSSLSRDFALAYILRWADPKYQNVCPKTHKLGDDLLQMIFGKVKHDDDEIAGEPIRNIKKMWANVTEHREEITVVRYDHYVDDEIIITPCLEAEVRIYDSPFPFDFISIFMMGKNRRYRKNSARRPGREVLILYYDGEEARQEGACPEYSDFGRFFRKDLLAVLDDNPNTGNIVIEEYREYLKTWAEDVTIRRSRP